MALLCSIKMFYAVNMPLKIFLKNIMAVFKILNRIIISCKVSNFTTFSF